MTTATFKSKLRYIVTLQCHLCCLLLLQVGVANETNATNLIEEAIKTDSNFSILKSFAVSDKDLSHYNIETRLSVALQHNSRIVRHFAAYQLGQKTKLSNANLTALIAAIRDDDTDLRALIVATLERHINFSAPHIIESIGIRAQTLGWPTVIKNAEDEIIVTLIAPLISSENIELSNRSLTKLLELGTRHVGARALPTALSGNISTQTAERFVSMLQLETRWQRELAFKILTVHEKIEIASRKKKEIYDWLLHDWAALENSPSCVEDSSGHGRISKHSCKYVSGFTDIYAGASKYFGSDGLVFLNKMLRSKIQEARSNAVYSFVEAFARSEDVERKYGKIVLKQLGILFETIDYIDEERMMLSSKFNQRYYRFLSNVINSKNNNVAQRGWEQLSRLLKHADGDFVIPDGEKSIVIERALRSFQRHEEPSVQSLLEQLFNDLNYTNHLLYEELRDFYLTQEQPSEEILHFLPELGHGHVDLFSNMIDLVNRVADVSPRGWYITLREAAQTESEMRRLYIGMLTTSNIDISVKWELITDETNFGKYVFRVFNYIKNREVATTRERVIALSSLLFWSSRTLDDSIEVDNSAMNARGSQVALLAEHGVDQSVVEQIYLDALASKEPGAVIVLAGALKYSPFDVSAFVNLAVQHTIPEVRAGVVDLFAAAPVNSATKDALVRRLLEDPHLGIRAAVLGAFIHEVGSVGRAAIAARNVKLFEAHNILDDNSNNLRSTILNVYNLHGRINRDVLTHLLDLKNRTQNATLKLGIATTILSVNPQNRLAQEALATALRKHLRRHVNGAPDDVETLFAWRYIISSIKQAENFIWLHPDVMLYPMLLKGERLSYENKQKNVLSEVFYNPVVRSARVSRRSGLPPFPWPVPEYSDKFLVDPTRFVSRGATLGAVKDALSSALSEANAGFTYGLFGNVPHGFVFLARLERIERDGTPFIGQRRWSNSPQKIDTFVDYLLHLFTAKPGYFRVIAFVVTTADDVPYDSAVNLPPVKRGWRTLPSDLAKTKFDNHKIFSLVYTFKRHQGGRLVTGYDGSPTAKQHLIAAGIWNKLIEAR